MTEQAYAPPSADLNPDSTEIQSLLTPLMATKFWVRLCSVMGFIFAAFMVIAALGMMAGGAAMSGQTGMPAGMGIGMGLVYLIFAAIYIVMSLYLYKYASAIGRASQTRSMTDVADALNQQKSFWKIAGVIVLVMTIFMVIGIVAAVMVPLMAS